MANGWVAGEDPFFQWDDSGFSVGGVDVGWGESAEDEEEVEYYPPSDDQPSPIWGTNDIGGYLLLGLGIAAVYMLVK